MRVIRMFAAAIAVAGAPLLTTSTTLAADFSREDVGREAKVPESAADHAALAKHYDEKAAEWRREATYHQEMAAAYKKSGGNPSDVATMERHCTKISKNAEGMAEEAKVMADYHRLRSR